MLARVEEESWQRARASACSVFRLTGKTDAGSMPLFGISVSVGIPVFFDSMEHLFVNTKTLRTLTFKVEECIF